MTKTSCFFGLVLLAAIVALFTLLVPEKSHVWHLKIEHQGGTTNLHFRINPNEADFIRQVRPTLDQYLSKNWNAESPKFSMSRKLENPQMQKSMIDHLYRKFKAGAVVTATSTDIINPILATRDQDGLLAVWQIQDNGERTRLASLVREKNLADIMEMYLKNQFVTVLQTDRYAVEAMRK